MYVYQELLAPVGNNGSGQFTGIHLLSLIVVKQVHLRGSRYNRPDEEQ